MKGAVALAIVAACREAPIDSGRGSIEAFQSSGLINNDENQNSASVASLELATLLVAAKNDGGKPIRLLQRNVRLVDEFGIIHTESAATDKALEYQVKAPGSYWVSAFAPGWKQCVQRVDLSPNISASVMLTMQPDTITRRVFGVTSEGIAFGAGHGDLVTPLRFMFAITDAATGRALSVRSHISLKLDGVSLYDGASDACFAIEIADRGRLVCQINCPAYAPYGLCTAVDDGADLDFGEIGLKPGAPHTAKLIMPSEKEFGRMNCRYSPIGFYSGCGTSWLEQCKANGDCTVVLGDDDYVIQGVAWEKSTLWFSSMTVVNGSRFPIQLKLEKTVPIVLAPIESDAIIKIEIIDVRDLLFATRSVSLNVPRRMYVIPGDYVIRYFAAEELIAEDNLRVQPSDVQVMINPMYTGR